MSDLVVRDWSPPPRGDVGAIGASLLLHASLFAALVVSVTWKVVEPPKPEVHSLEVSLVPGDASLAAIPKVAAPDATKTQPTPDVAASPVKPADPVEAVKDPSPSKADAVNRPKSSGSSDAAPATDAGAPDTGGLLWTPPAPKPNAADAAMSQQATSKTRVVLPQVTLGKGASDPVLLSYDQAHWSDPVSLSEAKSMSTSGRLSMTVTVDEKGAVSRCDLIGTSGSKIFDQRACALVSTYTYRPAQDQASHPHPALVVEVLEWSRDGGKAPVKMVTTPVAPAPAIPLVSLPKR